MNSESYIRELGSKIRSKIDPSKLPSQGLDELFDSYAVLALAKGVDVNNEDVHDAWSAWATKFDPQNSSLVPFDELSDSTKQQDDIFTKAIAEVASTL
ncbi:MAG: hypothetical protein NTV39_01050 [Candidatus Saccharibacteria bacterium]|nr:hypothetical protein [Candidatus Saccharibacteria bacterium]